MERDELISSLEDKSVFQNGSPFSLVGELQVNHCYFFVFYLSCTEFMFLLQLVPTVRFALKAECTEALAYAAGFGSWRRVYRGNATWSWLVWNSLSSAMKAHMSSQFSSSLWRDHCFLGWKPHERTALCGRVRRHKNHIHFSFFFFFSVCIGHIVYICLC